MERQLTFIDVDENRLELWLKPDRVQLVVIDSRPELEAAELRRFASVVFAEYVAPDLVDRLGAARSRLQEARDQARGVDPAVGPAAGPAPGGDLVAALDGALRAIDDLVAAVAIPVAPEAEPEAPEVEDAAPEASAFDPAPAELPEPAAPPAGAGPAALPFPAGHRPYPSLQATLRASRKRPRRGERAEEASAIRWGIAGGEPTAAP
jgi:hypothetical protein